MIAPSLLALALCFQPPPAAAPAAPTKDGSTTPATPAVSVRGLDAKAFAQEVDSLGDVRPATRTVLRAEAPIESVSVDIGLAGGAVKVRAAGKGLEAVAVPQSGAEVVLGSFGWDTQQLSWTWKRVSASSHRKALEALATALATCSIDVRLRGGSLVRLQPPVSRARVVLQPGSVSRVSAPVPPGKRPLIVVADGPQWTRDGTEDRVVLTCDAGDLVIAWDDAARECTYEWVSAPAIELEALRQDVLARKKELASRNSTERMIIEREIAALEDRMKDLEARLGAGAEPPPIPQVTLRSDSGREFAVIQAAMRKGSQ